jgi:hypothetical protein
MKKGKLLGTVMLLSVCLMVGVRYGVKYGWLAGHTHWTTERIRERPYL